MPGRNRRSRIWSYGSNTVISTILFVGIITVLALLAERHPWRMDLTETGKFTLSEQTRNVLKSLDGPVTIKAFYATAASDRPRARDLLESYQYHNKAVTFDFIDPDRQPDVARQYDVRTYGTVVLEGYNKKQTVQTLDEENLTNALLKMSREDEKKIYFLIGHGEHSLENFEKDGYSTVRSALIKENYAVEELNLLQQDHVPENAAAVIVAGPQKPLFSQEVESLQAYMERGGKLLVLLNPGRDGGLAEFLKGYGLELHDDIVIDKLSRVFGGSYLMPVVTEYGFHKITDNFSLATFFPEARSVRTAKETPENVHVEVLASTSANAWAETDLELLEKGEAGFDEKSDHPGPVPLITLVDVEHKAGAADKQASEEGENASDADEDADPKSKGILIVSGDSDFAGNTHFGLSGNGDLFLNMVNFLAEEENLITIEPRGGTGQAMLLTRNQARLVFWTTLVFVPLLVILSGLTVYRVRRSQR